MSEAWRSLLGNFSCDLSPGGGCGAACESCTGDGMLQNVSRGPTVSTAQNRALSDGYEEDFPSAHARATRILTSSREMAAAGYYSQEWKDARKGARKERSERESNCTPGLSQDDLGRSQDAPDRSAADATDVHSKRRQRRTLSGAAAAAAAGKRGARSKEMQVQSKLWMQSFQTGSQPRGVDFYRQSL